MRLFLALPLSADLRAHLTDAQARLRAQGVRANFSRPENLHLTLAFLGETPRARDAARVMAACRDAAFPLTVAGLGRFGGVLWAGVRPCPPLEALAEGLQAGLRAAGFSLEARPFRAHITLARQARLDGPLPELPPAEMLADRLLLLESLRRDGRLVYRTVQEKRLRA